MTSPSSTIPLERFSSFGDLLKFLRRRIGLTQRELSIAVGYSHAQVSRLELNQRSPDMPTVAARFIPALDLDSYPEAAARLLDLASVPYLPMPASGAAPYKGMQYFAEADADTFFGREALTSVLVERLQSATASSPPLRCLAVVGASGIGKSSIVRAGLVPALRQGRTSRSWQIHTLTPTAHPLQALAMELEAPDASLASTGARMDDFAAEPRSLHLLAERLTGHGRTEASPVQRAESEAPRLLLVIDQFEELFSLCQGEPERRAFIDNLMTAVTIPEGPVIVIVALRADFYDRCAVYPELRQALAQNQEYLGPMTSEDLQRAIEGPARWGHWEIEQGLLDLLLQDVGGSKDSPPEPGALPLLSHALLETWHRRSGRTLTVSGYLSSGGVRGAIAATADAVFEDTLDERQQAIARNVLLRLTHLGEDGSPGETRRRIDVEELVGEPQEAVAVREVLTILADARLITVDNQVVEVAHEALIREWPRLREWLEADREGLRMHRHLTLAAQSWADRRRDPSDLYRGARLAQALEWTAVHPTGLNRLEREFLDAAHAREEHEAAEREAAQARELQAARDLATAQSTAARQLRRRAVYLTGALLLTLAMAGVALFFGEQARRTAVVAQTERRVAASRELASAALINLGFDSERSILLGLQAVATTRDVDGTILPEALEALHRSIIASPLRMVLAGQGTRVLSATYSPDGRRLASIGDDGSIIVWDPQTGAEIRRWAGSTQPSDLVTSHRIAYSPDGGLLAALEDRSVRLLDASTGEAVRSLDGQPSELTALAFDRTGRRIAIGGADGSVWMWDLATAQAGLKLAALPDAVESVSFSPDGDQMVTASETSVRTWDARTGQSLGDDGAATEDQLRLISSTLNADATLRAEVDGNEVKVVEAASGRELLQLAGHTDWVMGVAFSPDGKRIATTSLDGTVRIWDLGPGQEAMAVRTPVGFYGTRVVYAPDGTLVATNGGDGSATLWDAATGEPLLTVHGHDTEVVNIAFSPDGKRLATAGLDGTTIVWETATGGRLLTLVGHTAGVRDIAFSPDGGRIATGGFDNTARIWDTSSGQELQRITGHDGLVLGVAFSPNGKLLATASTDATVKIWEAQTGNLLRTLAGDSVALDVAFSPDGSMLAVGAADGSVSFMDPQTGFRVATLSGHSAGAFSVAFSPDGAFLATGSADNTAKLWEVAKQVELLTLPGGEGGVYSVSFSPRGDRLAVASNDGVVRVFLTTVDELLALARARVTRSLSEPECKKFLHLEQCPTAPAGQP